MKAALVWLLIGALVLLTLPIVVPLWGVQAFAGSRRAVKAATAYDQLWNALLGGHEDETISSRAAKARAAGRRWGCVLCRIVDAIDRDHCDRFVELDRGKPWPIRFP